MIYHRIASPLKYHGGKSAFNGALAKWIVSLMPPRQSKAHPDGYVHFCEPYCGGCSVLLANDPDGISECVNDLDSMLMNFWRTLRSPMGFMELKRLCEATPFSESLFEASRKAIRLEPDEIIDPVTQAWWFFVQCRQSLAGRQDTFAPLSKTRTRAGMNEQASAWLTAIEGLPEVHTRLKRVVILCDSAENIIRQQDAETTLFYIDCPYVKASRSTPDVYEHEMSDEQHESLIAVLLTIKGKAIVSMYHHPIYDALHEKHGWRVEEFQIANNAAGGKTKKVMTECCWMNYPK